jgi:hypothetical protein
VGVDQVGRKITWGEAMRLLTVLAADPSSHLAAALAGWSHPMSREAMILADLFDVQLASKSKKKPQPYPRPWVKKGMASKRHGDTAGRSRADVVAILNAHGHQLPV